MVQMKVGYQLYVVATFTKGTQEAAGKILKK
jgi:hypothetical protein